MDWLPAFLDRLLFYLDSQGGSFTIKVESLKIIFDLQIIELSITPTINKEELISILFHYVRNPIVKIKDNIYTIFIGQLHLSDLPDDVVYQMLFYLPYKDIKNVCLSDNNLNRRICQSDNFWALKYQFESDAILPFVRGKMKEKYLNSNTLWGAADQKAYRYERHERGYLDVYPIQLTKIIFNQDSSQVKKVSFGKHQVLFIDTNDNAWIMGYQAYFPEVYSETPDYEKSMKDLQPKLIANEAFKVKDVARGDNHSLFLDFNNKVYGMENNSHYQLGTAVRKGNRAKNVTFLGYTAKKVFCYDKKSFIIDLNDNLIGFGKHVAYPMSGNEKPLYIGHNFLKAKYVVSCETYSEPDIYLKYSCTLIIDIYDNLWSYGNNNKGQLGLGNYSTKSSLNLVNNQLFRVKFAYCKFFTSYVTDLEDNLYIFGEKSLPLDEQDIDPMNKNRFVEEDLQTPTPVKINGANLKIKKLVQTIDRILMIDLNNDLLIYGPDLNFKDDTWYDVAYDTMYPKKNVKRDDKLDWVIRPSKVPFKVKDIAVGEYYTFITRLY